MRPTRVGVGGDLRIGRHLHRTLAASDLGIVVVPMRRGTQGDHHPYAEAGLDIVVECAATGVARAVSVRHLEAGARHVVVCAPEGEADTTIIFGVNDNELDPAIHRIVSTASAGAQCFAPMVKVLDDFFGVRNGLVARPEDSRTSLGARAPAVRRDAATVGIVLSTETGSRAAAIVGQSIRGEPGVVIETGSPATTATTEFTAVLECEPSVDEVNAAFADASAGRLAGLLAFADAPVEPDVVLASSASCVFDAAATMTLGSMVKVTARHNFSRGPSCRLVDLVRILRDVIDADQRSFHTSEAKRHTSSEASTSVVAGPRIPSRPVVTPGQP